MKSLCGVQTWKDIDELYKCKSEHWIQTEYDDNVLDCWILPNGDYFVNIKKDDVFEGESDVRNTLPCHLGAFTRGKKRIMKTFFWEINGFYNDSLYYGDTDSIYI